MSELSAPVPDPTGRPLPVSLVDVGSYLPERLVTADFYGGEDDALSASAMFRSPRHRRHVAPGETAVDMIEKAARPVLERAAARGDGPVDVLLTNVQLPDLPWTGAGAAVAHRLGQDPGWVLDLHNGGCVSFVHLLRTARQILRTGEARSALICCVQNTAGQMFAQSEVRRRSHASVPGDGCGVGYLRVGDESPILDVEVRNVGEYAADMGVRLEDRRYWEPGHGQLDVAFTPHKVRTIIDRGNALVPEVVGRLCARLGVPTSAIDLLVTNQPNRLFLRHWRDALGLDPARHPDTFDEYGNLFGAAVPVTLAEALRQGRPHPGDLLVLAGFAHAGDIAAAAAVRWHPPSP
ncbi:3-oxoacyl-ACP synthase III family protein [Micromonospora cathayae]|uniref:3-oxoacyl-[acyl-carrier-protein] synthase III C-terminal domain-containing protein n=1 Tax=Micromonospora cathayae TaxID=3028804 RepID=A0ABY7ZXF7_9ACTN|nr:3-oxoacyl-[acyl-carrier-protein] synthase III C-terminal domain-containing protein [Micromonospora sp. HUAS 3]WDZ86439.1 3-oxoacyl-[acyl-carrier-protein] synthase III C-terminal domain-containing protein [Micromonospora sp. HUAS 3]